MAASIWKLTLQHRFLKFQPPAIRCRYLRGKTFEIRWSAKPYTVQDTLESVPGFTSPKAPPTGRHAGEMQTLSELLKQLNAKDPELEKPIDIGLPTSTGHKRSEIRTRDFVLKQRSNEELEKAARLRTLKIPLDEVKADWEVSDGLQAIRTIAEHYGIFRDLFDDAHFLPQVQLRVNYDYDDKLVTPVYRGNHITPSEAKSAPCVHFDADPNTLWTLVLTNPDGHLLDNSSEYLHWFIGNIPGGAVEKGDVICEYMQPFPPKGTGYHRFIFILYKQEHRIDYSKFQKPSPCCSLKERTFSTYDFYKEQQDFITPAGLAFFQSQHDESLRDFFHKVLVMREPMFEYDHPPPYIRPQIKYPHREPFNLYLDKYRNPKDIEKEILLKRFKTVHPFDGEPPRPKYPNIYPVPKFYPSWLTTELFKERMRIGKYRGLDVQIFKPERPKRVPMRDFSGMDREYE